MRSLLLLILVSYIGIAWAADDDSKSAKKAQTKKSSGGYTFEDLLVQGKYHFSDEAVSTVEEDKVLDALLGIRKDFKDRIERSASRY